MANQKHTDDHRQHDRDKLKPEMRHLARVDETDALRDTAYHQETAQGKDGCEGRHHWPDQRENAGHNHHAALYQIPR